MLLASTQRRGGTWEVGYHLAGWDSKSWGWRGGTGRCAPWFVCGRARGGISKVLFSPHSSCSHSASHRRSASKSGHSIVTSHSCRQVSSWTRMASAVTTFCSRGCVGVCTAASWLLRVVGLLPRVGGEGREEPELVGRGGGRPNPPVPLAST